MDVLGKVIDVRSAELNGAHRLAPDLRFLNLDCGGSYRELVNGEGALQPAIVGTRPEPGDALLGRLTAFSSSGSLAYDDAAANLRITGDVTLAAGLIKTGTVVSFSAPVERTANNGATVPFTNYLLSVNPNNAGQRAIDFAFNAGGSIRWTTTGNSGSPVANTYFPGDNLYAVCGGSVNASSARLMVDGAMKASCTASGVSSANTNAKFILGGSSAASVTTPWVGFVPWSAVWARYLSDDEWLELNDLLFDDSGSGLLIVPKRRAYFFLDPGAAAGGGTTVTQTTSLDAAIQRQGLTKTASLDAAVQVSRTATAQLDAAIRAARSATASLGAAIRAPRTSTASVDSAVQAARSAAADVDAAVQVARSLGVSVDAFVQSGTSLSLQLDAAIRFAATRTVGADAAIQAARSLSASLDAAVAIARSASASLDAAISLRRAASSEIDAAVRAALSHAVSLDAYVNDPNAAQRAPTSFGPGARSSFAVTGRSGAFAVPGRSTTFTVH